MFHRKNCNQSFFRCFFRPRNVGPTFFSIKNIFDPKNIFRPKNIFDKNVLDFFCTICFPFFLKKKIKKNQKSRKKLVTLLDLCVSSLRRGHANLLCIVPILTDDPRRESERPGASEMQASAPHTRYITVILCYIMLYDVILLLYYCYIISYYCYIMLPGGPPR